MRPLLLSFLLIPFLSGAQELKTDSLTGKYMITAVIPVDSLNKENLFAKAKEWIALTYRNANDVVQLSDKDAGKIICKGGFSTNLFLKQGWLMYTLILEFKDNRFRYTYTDFAYYSNGSGAMDFESKSLGFKKKLFKETEDDVKLNTKRLIASFKDKSSDNW